MPHSPADLRTVPPTDDVRPADADQTGAASPKALAWLLLAGGLVGLAASFVLAIEKYALLVDPEYVPTCSLNPVLSCGSIMASQQAEAFGFPNPLLGVAGFSVVAATGAALVSGARLAGWFWAGLQVGVTAAVVFVHWLIFSSLYRIGALCPYCMVVWAVTIPMFWYVSLRNATAASDRWPPGPRRALSGVRSLHGVVLTVWFLLIAAAILQRFWLFWSSSLG